MSISASLANALSGLTAAGRAAEVISANVANAMTPGYGRREIELASRSLGGTGAGVRVEGVTRAVNQSVLGERRLADAEAGNAALRSAALARIETAIGLPEDEGALTGQIAALESALVAAASRPDSTARLEAVLTAADRLAGKLGAVSRDLQQSRMEADQRIAAEVGTLNASLSEIDRLNAEITAFRALGRDANALMDQRQLLVDRIATIVPLREVPRPGGQISLYTTGGAILLDSLPVEIGFAPAGVITPDMTLGSGALSGLTINGRPVAPDDDGVLGGGTLGALFAQRDEIAPRAQAQLDAVARDLVERFATPAVDPTLAPGAAGLFTDGGAALDPLDETGLAGRIAVNAAADPGRGGALWRLRDGLGAAAPGEAGSAALLQSLAAALASPRVPASGAFIGAARPAAGLAADVLSGIATERQAAETRTSYTAARQDALTALVLQDGVDTDGELQILLQVEQAYAANARVIQTMDDLLQRLIGL